MGYERSLLTGLQLNKISEDEIYYDINQYLHLKKNLY